MPGPVQGRQGRGADLVHSWAWSGAQDQGSPRAKHLLLPGKHTELPLCLMPALCDPTATWAAGNLHPQRPESAGVLQKPGSTQLWSTHCPEDPQAPSCAASNIACSQAPLPKDTQPGWRGSQVSQTNLSVQILHTDWEITARNNRSGINYLFISPCQWPNHGCLLQTACVWRVYE